MSGARPELGGVSVERGQIQCGVPDGVDPDVGPGSVCGESLEEGSNPHEALMGRHDAEIGRFADDGHVRGGTVARDQIRARLEEADVLGAAFQGVVDARTRA